MSREAREAAERLRRWLHEFSGLRGLDPDLVHTAHSDSDGPGPAQLRVSDLETVLNELDNKGGTR
jgi:hypothetical protein